MADKPLTPATPVLLLVLFATACAEPVHVRDRWEALGMQATAELYATTSEGAEEARLGIREAYERAGRIFCADRPEGELDRLNHEAAREPYAIQDPDLYRSIKLALEWARASQGAFDPTAGPLMRLYGLRDRSDSAASAARISDALEIVGWQKITIYPEAQAIRFHEPGMELDLGGILEGYALDMGARHFGMPGFQAGLLSLGNTLYAWRRPPGRKGWTVSIRDPRDRGLTVGSLEIENRALSVAGSFTAAFDSQAPMVSHIMKVAEGGPAVTDVFAAVAIADSGADADAISTALYVLGTQGSGSLLERTHRVEALMLARGTEGPYLLASASLKGRLLLDAEFSEKIAGRVRYLLPPLAFR